VTTISYDDVPVTVRRDLREAHRRAWDRLAEPGTWWTGAERVAIAAEVRNARCCRLCTERRASLTAVSGDHDVIGVLSDAAVEAVHRIASDNGRLSRSWYDGVLAAGLSEGHYVEIVGVVASVVNIDAFCRAMGVPPRTLPAPKSGEPSRHRPAGAVPGEAWVSMIPARRAVGPEADLYAGMPGAPNVIRAMSLVPDEVRALRDLSDAQYVGTSEMLDLSSSRSLDRMQIELIAARVSVLNECFY
jgi:hypothetical protein